MCRSRAGRRRRRRRPLVALGSPTGLQVPETYSPGAGTCDIRYTFERQDFDSPVILQVRDRNNRIVYEHDNLGLLYLSAANRPPFTDHWDGRDTDGHYVMVDRGPLTVELKVGENESLTREVRLELSVTVTPNSDYRQYINMTQGNLASHQGREIPVTVRVTPPQENREVFFELEAHRGNKTGLSESDRASLRSESVRCGADGNARTRLTLSTYGGDRFRVKVKLERDGEEVGRTGWFHVWRRLFFEVSEMPHSDMPDAVIRDVRRSMAAVNIQMDRAAEKHTGRNVEFLSSADAFRWAAETCTTARVPLKVHYGIVDYSGTRANDRKRATVNRRQMTLNGAFRPFDFNGTDWLISARYRARGGSGAWHDFPEGNVTLVDDNPSRRIRVSFAGTGVNPRRTPQSVDIRYRRADLVCGWGSPTSVHVVICRGTINEYYTTAGAGAAANRRSINHAMAATSVHEPGHAMGLVFDQSWETSDAAHSAHCAQRRCVMWWQIYHDIPLTFHTADPGCALYLKGRDLSASSMRSAWAFSGSGS